MSTYRGMGRALDLRQGQPVRVYYDPDTQDITIKGVSDGAYDAVYDALAFDQNARLRVDPNSLVLKTGAQFIIKEV